MKRRALLGGVTGALAATAGCLDAVPLLGGGAPLKLRTMRVDPKPEGAGPANVTEPTDVTCELSAEFVADHPELERMLDEARDAETGEMRTTGISRETGDDLVMDLESYCERTGGLYFHDGDAFFVSVAFTDSGDAVDHHSGDGGDDHTHTST